MEEFADKAETMMGAKLPKLMGQLLDNLNYLEKSDQEFVKKAYVFANIAHEEQLRKSGEPYINHPIEVAKILADLRLDKESIAAGLLHDVLEDSEINQDLIAKEFGQNVLNLVDGVSKLDQIEYSENENTQADSFRKMMLAMVEDIRVILIKLSDRLHNMQTLDALDKNKQKKIARETLDIYAPIANRLGIYHMKRALETDAFQYAYPFRQKILSNALKRGTNHQKKILRTITSRFRKNLEQAHIEAEIQSRKKDLYSIYKKMKNRKLSFDQIIDVYGVRIIVERVEECYQVLGLVHQIYKPIMDKFNDYIAIPRINGYQSLHTSLLGPGGTPIEIQIRTKAMNRVAESGIAAHWKYKTENEDDVPPQIKAREWLATIQEIQGVTHPEEFLESIKVDLYPDKVYVFTPKGKILRLPVNSTCVDFAYAVHTDVGNSCIGAKIDRQQVPLRTVIESGQTVEIMTTKRSNPDPSWLNFIATAKARLNIRNYLKNLNASETIALGKRLFDHALTMLGKKQRNISRKQLKNFLDDLGFNNSKDLYRSIGTGDKNPILMAQILLGESESDDAIKEDNPLYIKGTEGVSVSFPKCCTPIPGDTIIGHLSKQRGLVVHRRNCRHVSSFIKDTSRWIGVEWDESIEHSLSTDIKVHVMHKPGSLAEVASTIADKGCNVEQVAIDSEHEDETVDLLFSIQTKNRLELADVMREIKKMKNVIKISRRLH
jgi:RelA/SpoT family (p)ppGpp synthetase